MRSLLLLSVLVGAAPGVFGDAAARATSLLDAAIARGAYPGVQYAVVGPEGLLYEYYGGLADVAGGRPMDAATTMMAYSMTKTFTAVAVLQLVETGKLSLDQSVVSLVPSFPYGEGVTVRHLLAQTSGLPNPMPLKWVHPAAAHASYDEDAVLAAVLSAHGKPASEPGRRYGYSNISYWVLGKVIERASGLAYPAYMERHVLAPLGLGPGDAGFVIADPSRHAKGYLARGSVMNLLKGLLVDRALIGGREGRWVNLRDHYLNGPAFGGLIATTRAVAAFLKDQLSPASVLLGPATRRMLYAQQTSNDGKPVPMTLGWHVGRMDDEVFYYKEGGGGGYHCEMRIYPSRGLASVILTNETGSSITRMQEEADRLFLAAAGSP